MTNEQLAGLIGQGGNDELLPLLWEKMRRFYRMASRKYVDSHAERCLQCGVTSEDIMQESYFAMLDSIAAYNARPSGQAAMKFISFCGFPFKNHAAALIGIRTAAGRGEPLNTFTTSLDEPIPSEDGDGDTPRVELIPDKDAEQPFREIEQSDYCRSVRETVAEALYEYPKELETVEHVYYNGKTMVAAGEIMHISVERVRQLKQSALRRLRADRKLRELYSSDPYRHVGYKEFLRCGSVVEQITERQLSAKEAAVETDKKAPNQ